MSQTKYSKTPKDLPIVTQPCAKYLVTKQSILLEINELLRTLSILVSLPEDSMECKRLL